MLFWIFVSRFLFRELLQVKPEMDWWSKTFHSPDALLSSNQNCQSTEG